jgi:hypothetical protein
MNDESTKEKNKREQKMEKVDEREGSRDHELVERVGYKKPPRGTRFKPGRSGNPNGRPRIRETVRTRVMDLFLRKSPVTLGNRKIKMTQIEIMWLGQFRKAMQGDTKAVQFCMKAAEQFGCLDHMFKGREIHPRDYLFPPEDLNRLSLEEIEQLITLHDKAFGDPSSS